MKTAHMQVVSKKVAIAMIPLFFTTVACASDGQFSGQSTKGNLSVWRVNHGNGSVSLCSFEGHKSEPQCYPWSAGGSAGNYQIIGGDDVLSTWRINASNGAVSLCEYKDVSEPPICTPWSTQ